MASMGLWLMKVFNGMSSERNFDLEKQINSSVRGNSPLVT